MDSSDFGAALARDGAAFIDTCEAAGLDAQVPACPDWTVGDLLWHVAEVYDFWTFIVRDRADAPDGYVQPERPAPAELPAFARGRLAAAVEVLGAAEPAQPNWTWSDDRSAGFVQRRMAQETAVHLADAQAAAGRPMSIAPALASDGIDEFLTHFFGWPDDSSKGSVHLHCTDVPGEWTVSEIDGDSVVTREHAKGDCALRGAASDLLLVLWRRLPLSAADVVGDAEVAAAFVAATRLE